MAKMMKDIFKEKLQFEFDPTLKEFPSPEELKYRVFVKVRDRSNAISSYHVHATHRASVLLSWSPTPRFPTTTNMFKV